MVDAQTPQAINTKLPNGAMMLALVNEQLLAALELLAVARLGFRAFEAESLLGLLIPIVA